MNSIRRFTWMKFFVILHITFGLIFNCIVPLSYAQTIDLNRFKISTPIPSKYIPTIFKGMTIHPENPLALDFIIDTGDSSLKGKALEEEGMKMVKYFMASLTLPEKDLWVNLSPVEKNRIAPDTLSVTEMGRDMLAQDYILKKITSSLMNPNTELGNKFWQNIYQEAQNKLGTTQIPVGAFNKVWIVPERVIVYEHKSSVLIGGSFLKVMLEEDYLASPSLISKRGLGGVASQVMRDIILPVIEKEVNEGKDFANLRQIYNAMILAVWFKKNLKNSLLGQIYVDQSKTEGINNVALQTREKMYKQYLEAFRKGAYNFIKEDVDPVTGQSVPRKYFSGGINAIPDAAVISGGKLALQSEITQARVLASRGPTATLAIDLTSSSDLTTSSKAMTADFDGQAKEMVATMTPTQLAGSMIAGVPNTHNPKDPTFPQQYPLYDNTDDFDSKEIGFLLIFWRNYTREILDRVRNKLNKVTDRFKKFIMFVSDSEEGRNFYGPKGKVNYPGNEALGNIAARNLEDGLRLAEAQYYQMGLTLKAAGQTMVYAPVGDVDIPGNPVIGMRSFGEDSEIVAALEAAAVRGLLKAGVAPVAKHFPGHGWVQGDSHDGIPMSGVRNQEDLEKHLAPFRAAVKAGVPAIMSAHIQAFPDLSRPATLSKHWMNGILRSEGKVKVPVIDKDGKMTGESIEIQGLGFKGLLISDAMEMGLFFHGVREEIIRKLKEKQIDINNIENLNDKDFIKFRRANGIADKEVEKIAVQVLGELSVSAITAGVDVLITGQGLGDFDERINEMLGTKYTPEMAFAGHSAIEQAQTPQGFQVFNGMVLKIDKKRIQEAAARSLALRLRFGNPDDLPSAEEAVKMIGSQEQKNLANEIARKSSVLIQAGEGVPITKKSNVMTLDLRPGGITTQAEDSTIRNMQSLNGYLKNAAKNVIDVKIPKNNQEQPEATSDLWLKVAPNEDDKEDVTNSWIEDQVNTILERAGKENIDTIVLTTYILKWIPYRRLRSEEHTSELQSQR